MAQCKFKTGDRVHWEGDDYSPEDSGTVQPDSFKGLPEGCVWVKWDSNGAVLYVHEDEIEHEQHSNQGVEFTVQNCIDFLIAQGYSVTFAKEYQ